MNNLTIVGTNHVSQASQKAITEAFADHDPDVVAIELDKERLASLRENERSAPSFRIIKHVGFTAYLFALIAHHTQQFIGRRTGVLPGEEMLHAADLAAKHNKPVHLIDQPFNITLQAVNDALTIPTILKLIKDVLISPFAPPPIAFDPGSIPDEQTIKQITAYIEQQYPTLHKALIADRDRYMARELRQLLDDETTVLAVIGAAHKSGVQQHIAHDD